MTNADPTPPDPIGHDELLEDLFGLSTRALHSLYVCFANPRRYFEAARHKDWLGTYAPSFRLWFSLIAVISIFQFFWAGANSATLAAAAEQLAELAASYPNVTAETLALDYTQWTFGLMPVCLAVCLLGLAAVYPQPDHGGSFALRERTLFITVIPGTVLSAIATIALGIVPEGLYLVLLAGSYGISLSADICTSYRGANPSRNRRQKLSHAALFGTALLATSFLAALLANMAASIMLRLTLS